MRPKLVLYVFHLFSLAFQQFEFFLLLVDVLYFVSFFPLELVQNLLFQIFLGCDYVFEVLVEVNWYLQLIVIEV